jgi:hypothetical protein
MPKEECDYVMDLLQLAGWKQVPCSCCCGGDTAWLKPRQSGAYEMVGCVCHCTPSFDEALHAVRTQLAEAHGQVGLLRETAERALKYIEKRLSPYEQTEAEDICIDLSCAMQATHTGERYLDSKAVNRLYDLVDEAVIQIVRAAKVIERALEQTTQVGERWKAISRVVEAARKLSAVWDDNELIMFARQSESARNRLELRQALAALEGSDKNDV